MATSDRRPPFYIAEVVVDSLREGRAITDVIAEAERYRESVVLLERNSQRRSLVLLTVFLPIFLIGAIPFRSHRGSRFTIGQVILGFGAFLAVPGFVLALISRQWWAAFFCFYWWLGARLLQDELIHRGLY